MASAKLGYSEPGDANRFLASDRRVRGADTVDLQQIVLYDGTQEFSAAIDSTGHLAVDTEMPAAAALGDSTANPTVPGVGAFNVLYNGSTWDRMKSWTAVAGSASNVGLLAVLPALWSGTVWAAAFTSSGLGDAGAGTNLPAAGMFVYNGSTFDRVRSVSGTLDASHLTGVPAAGVVLHAGTGDYRAWRTAASTADGATHQIGGIGNYIYNGSTWDRARSAGASKNTSGTGLPGVGILALDSDGATYRAVQAVVPGGDGYGLGNAGAYALNTISASYVYNGASWDRARGDATHGATVRVHQPGNSTVTRATQATANTNTTLKASNTSRRTLKVFNEAGGTMYLKEGVTATTTDYTAQVPQGAFYEVQQPAYTGQVDCVWTSPNGVAQVTEQT
jgi:hypothetical protein